MMLADLGAEVIRVGRFDDEISARGYVMHRGRRAIAVDLKADAGRDLVLRMVEMSDALLEGFRPGVAERLGIGPAECLERNPRLVYGRMTGWGQDGPYADLACHDINCVALSGALHMIGRRGDRPVPPVNMLADFAGGGMLLAFGLVCALLETKNSGRGQVVDAAMIDGVSLLTSVFHGHLAQNRWIDERGCNLLDTGAPFYDVYECSDGRYVSVGALEPQFYAVLCSVVGLDPQDWPQHDRTRWAELNAKLTETFRSKTRDEWCGAFEGTDACFAPVLSLSEAAAASHSAARDSFIEVAGIRQPAPAPRFSRTPGAVSLPPPLFAEHTDEVLSEFGLSGELIASLHAADVIR
jgi:alpha-methylacyl-CoA racemase